MKAYLEVMRQVVSLLISILWIVATLYQLYLAGESEGQERLLHFALAGIMWMLFGGQHIYNNTAETRNDVARLKLEWESRRRMDEIAALDRLRTETRKTKGQ